jgi:hypothetical protein
VKARLAEIYLEALKPLLSLVQAINKLLKVVQEGGRRTLVRKFPCTRRAFNPGPGIGAANGNGKAPVG